MKLPVVVTEQRENRSDEGESKSVMQGLDKAPTTMIIIGLASDTAAFSPYKAKTG